MAQAYPADTPDEFRSRMLALGYASGRRDAMPELTRMDAPVPTEFAQSYVDAVTAYYAGDLRTRPTLSDAWETYRETGRVS